MEELRRQAGWAKTFGLPLELISADEAQRLFPPMSTDGVLGAAYLPTDGYIDPAQLTFALVEWARRGGAEVCTNTRVTGIGVERGRVARRRDRPGHDRDGRRGQCRRDVRREIGAMVGVTVPIVPMAHEYLITKPMGLPLDIPTMRDPSLLVYFRGESGGLVAGGYERDPAPWGLDGIPADFNGKLLAEDWERFEPLMENAVVRVPALETRRSIKLVNGPEAFTPDGEFILGPTDVRGFWVAAGFCAHGLAGAGGMGQLVAEWIVEGKPASTSGTWTRGASAPLREPRLHARAHGRGVLDLLRREVPRPGAAGGTAAARLADLPAAPGARRGVGREVGMGAGELVRAERRRRGRVAAAARVGRAALVAGDRGRAPRLPGGRGDLRRDVVREDRRDGAGRGGVPRAAVRQPRRARGRRSRVHADAERAGRHRVRLHRDAVEEDRFRIVTGTAFGRHDLAWMRAHAPEDGACRSPT